jgi:hypothetical protein
VKSKQCLEQRDPAGLKFGWPTDEFGLDGAGSFISPSRDVTRHVARGVVQWRFDAW